MTVSSLIRALFLTTILVGCKPPAQRAPTAAVLKDEGGGGSCDLQKMGEASRAAALDNFRCAYDALKTAGKLATGTVAADVVKIVDGATDLYAGIEAMDGVLSDLEAYVAAQGKDPDAEGLGLDGDELGGDEALGGAGEERAAADETGASEGGDKSSTADQIKGGLDKTKAAVGATKLGRTAMFQCLAGLYEPVKGAYELFKLATELKGSERLGAEQLKILIDLGFKGITDVVLKMTEGPGRCAEWMQGRRIKEFNRLLAGVEKLAAGVDALRVIARCGVDITKGAVLLAQNTACAVDDVKGYYESRKSLQQQRQNYADSTSNANNAADGYMCNGEIDGQNLRAMRKVGIWFGKEQTALDYKSRATRCAEYCGNDLGRRQGTCEANADAIFGGDAGSCRHVCGLAQSRGAIEMCTAQCCDGESRCAGEARKTADRKGWLDGVPKRTIYYGVDPTAIPAADQNRLNAVCARGAIFFARNAQTCREVNGRDRWAASHCENMYDNGFLDDFGKRQGIDQKPERAACLGYCENWLHTCCPDVFGKRPADCN